MADRSGLKFVGFIFATVTLAVMLTTGDGGEGLCRRRLFARSALDRQPVS